MPSSVPSMLLAPTAECTPLLRRIESRLGIIEPLLGKFESPLGIFEPLMGRIEPFFWDYKAREGIKYKAQFGKRISHS